jgi:hypothetical protein
MMKTPTSAPAISEGKRSRGDPGPGITRRELASVLLAVAATACAPRKKEVFAAFKRLAEEQGLCILGLDGAAINADGSPAGRLDLPGAPTPHVAVSPDGACVAWTDARSAPYATDLGGPMVFLVEDHPRSKRTVRFDGGFASAIAVSSKAGNLALVSVRNGGLDRRLIVLNPATGRVQRDVTALITRFSLDEIQTLRISATGGHLVVGSRELFCVIDLRSATVAYGGSGRFPRISPDGGTLAFVDNKQALWRVTLSGGPPKRLMRGWAVPGAGAWSPDGRFLLAGARTSLYYFDELVVIDSANDSFAPIGSLGEGNQGPLFSWIKRTLLAG